MKFEGVFWGAGVVTAKTGTRKPPVYSCTEKSMLFPFREIRPLTARKGKDPGQLPVLCVTSNGHLSTGCGGVLL